MSRVDYRRQVSDLNKRKRSDLAGNSKDLHLTFYLRNVNRVGMFFMIEQVAFYQKKKGWLASFLDK